MTAAIWGHEGSERSERGNGPIGRVEGDVGVGSPAGPWGYEPLPTLTQSLTQPSLPAPWSPSLGHSIPSPQDPKERQESVVSDSVLGDSGEGMGWRDGD